MGHELARAEFLFKWIASAEEIAVLKNVPDELQRLGRVMHAVFFLV
jgi:hypothetical protein